MQSGCSLAEVWEQQEPVLRSIVKTILLDHSLIDDVLQDAFTQVLKMERQFVDNQEAYNYARRAVINTAIDYYRKIRKRQDFQRKQLSEDYIDTRTPLAALVRREEAGDRVTLMKEVQTAFSQLSSEQQEAINMILGRTRKIKDICQETGIPYSTLRSRLLSGVDQIREQLRARGLLRRSGNFELHEVKKK